MIPNRKAVPSTKKNSLITSGRVWWNSCAAIELVEQARRRSFDSTSGQVVEAITSIAATDPEQGVSDNFGDLDHSIICLVSNVS
jgi:hypothetical protein